MTNFYMHDSDDAIWKSAYFEGRSITRGVYKKICGVAYSSLFLDACFFMDNPRYSVFVGYKRPTIAFEGYGVDLFKCYD